MGVQMKWKAWDIVSWLGLFTFYAPAILVAKVLAPLAVLFVDRKNHPIWGVKDAVDLGWWNTGVRNGAHNLFTKPMVRFYTYGNTDDESLEALDGFQWRYRRSEGAGNYCSFRMTWGEPRDKGKREFYIGWKMNYASPTMTPTFFQFRPF